LGVEVAGLGSCPVLKTKVRFNVHDKKAHGTVHKQQPDNKVYLNSSYTIKPPQFNHRVCKTTIIQFLLTFNDNLFD